jgi:hypothetical protein
MSGYLAERTRAVGIAHDAMLKAEAARDRALAKGNTTGALVQARCAQVAAEIEAEIAGVATHD